jgi:aspartyl-tRNA(Asn)/glutamyl-tRNA(Gln) amidotransferase subunit C
MIFTEQELDNLSSLARIDITKEEKQKMLQDMQAILGYVSEINSIEGTDTKQQHLVHNVVREDIVTRNTGSNTEALMSEAPATKDGYVKVEQVLK